MAVDCIDADAITHLMQIKYLDRFHFRWFKCNISEIGMNHDIHIKDPKF